MRTLIDLSPFCSSPSLALALSANDADEIFRSFGQIIALARELNINIAVPEIVIAAAAEARADQFLNALLGETLLPPVVASSSRARPLQVHVQHVAEREQPRFLVKTDHSDAKVHKSAGDAAADVAAALAHKHHHSAVTLTIESARVWNLLIHVPLALTGKADDDAATLTLCQDARRLIVGLEKAREWDSSSIGAFVRQADAKGDRTVLLYTAFAEFVATCAGTRELNAWLAKSGAAAIDSKVHFATLGELDKLDALAKADMELLEQMQYDLRFERAVGVEGTRRQVLDLSFRKYQEFVPAVLKTLRGYKADAVANHARTKAQIASMESYRLRAVANQHVMTFLQTIEKLCKGTLEGIPSQNGQTAAEEREASGVLWRDATHAVRAVDDAKWKVTGADAKLYGGQQFERLLSEFRALVLNTPMPELSHSDIAVAAGPTRLGGAPSNIAWSASELARRAVAQAFVPLTDQLFERAVYVFERQLHIAERIMEQQAKQQRLASSRGSGIGGAHGAGASSFGLSDHAAGNATFGASVFGASSGADAVAAQHQGAVGGGASGADSAVQNVKDFPYFTSAVKSFYLDVVYALADRTRAKCLDEFRCTQLVQWNGGAIDDAKLPSSKKRDDAKELKKSVTALAQDLFDGVKKRLADNIVLKCHNSLLVPISEFLYTEIQGKISRLTDADIETMFEVLHTRAKLQREETQLESVTKRFDKLEGDFMSAAEQFARTRQFH